MQQKVKLSLLLLGSKGCGKSSLVQRWISPLNIPRCTETLAIDVVSNLLRIGGTYHMVRFWDTTGADHYDDLLERYIYNADCCVVVFDVTNVESWEKAKYWVETIKKTNGRKVPVCLVSNKIDMESKRKIHKADVMDYVRTSDMKCLMCSETSAITGENMKATYRLIVTFCRKPVREVWTYDQTPSSASGCLIV